MTSFLDSKGLQSQYIDQDGKLRMVTLQISIPKTLSTAKISIMTSPLPPLALPQQNPETKPVLATKKTLKAFLKAYRMELASQDGDEEKIQGVWLKPKPEWNLFYGYVLLKPQEPFPNIPFAPIEMNDPLLTSAKSVLSDTRKNREIASYLKNYILYLYATSKDREKFLREYDSQVVVKPGYEYEEKDMNKFYNLDSSFFSKGKLVVPDEEIKTRLKSFLKVSIFTDLPGVMNHAKRTRMTGMYQMLSDFSTHENQLVFMSRDSLERWRGEREVERRRNQISIKLNEDSLEPYFYTTERISGSPVFLIQNVKDANLNRALAVAKKWSDERVNMGYFSNPIEEEEHRVIDEVVEFSHINPKELHVISYGGDKYAAALFF